MKKKIIIIDDHKIIRDGIRAVFKKSTQYEMVADFDNEKDMLEYLSTSSADVILMDINLRNANGIDITKRTKSIYPSIKIIMHSMTNEPYITIQSKLNGADGYVLKSDGQNALELAIENVYRNSPGY